MSIFIKSKVALDNTMANISESVSSVLAKVKWEYVRLLLIAAGVIPNFFTSSNGTQEAIPIMWQFVPAAFVFGVVGLQFIIGFQAYNPVSAKVWLRPDWKLNPFSLSQPLQFFHFSGWYMLASSLQLMPAAIKGNEESMYLAASTASFGLGMLVGVRLSVLIYRRKFDPA